MAPCGPSSSSPSSRSLGSSKSSAPAATDAAPTTSAAVTPAPPDVSTHASTLPAEDAGAAVVTGGEVDTSASGRRTGRASPQRLVARRRAAGARRARRLRSRPATVRGGRPGEARSSPYLLKPNIGGLRVVQGPRPRAAATMASAGPHDRPRVRPRGRALPPRARARPRDHRRGLGRDARRLGAAGAR